MVYTRSMITGASPELKTVTGKLLLVPPTPRSANVRDDGVIIRVRVWATPVPVTVKL